MVAEVLVLVALPLLLAVAAGWDLASFTIPNFLSLALLALFAVFAVAAHLSLPAIGWHLLAGFAGLFIGFALFALGWIGGGDAKLFAAVTLWLGFHDMAPYSPTSLRAPAQATKSLARSKRHRRDAAEPIPIDRHRTACHGYWRYNSLHRP